LPLDGFFACYHTDADGCDCRKPSPGLLIRAADQFDVSLQSSFMVGDRWRDVDAGRRAGCRSILLDYGYLEREPEQEPVARLKSLRDAAEWIIASLGEGNAGIESLTHESHL
jgi:D-glycero-D-manno-heptose 1,7-bisphosphate phosphatase